MKIEVPAEKLAAAVNKFLMPAVLKKLSQQKNDSKEMTVSK